MVVIRESSITTRDKILKSAIEIFLEVGYQEASMRKIAARAGITAGAIYKHFSGKEEMFGEIFEAYGRKLIDITESMMGVDFSAMTDEELRKLLYKGASEQTFNMLEDDMKLFHMLLKNDSGKYMERFCDIYIERCAGFAANYYEELYRRKIAGRRFSKQTFYMLAVSEFSVVCEIIADDSCKDGITPEMRMAFMEVINVLRYGICAELDIDLYTGGDR